MERRLAAILAADVVGYSRLMGVDEGATLSALKAHHAELIDGEIAEHHGRIVKLTGDGMLVEFASIVNAVACAVEIQRRMRDRNANVPKDRRIEFRVGVNLGDVIVEGDDIFGDGVNVAARLEGIARPGGIAISGSARDHVGSRLDLSFEDLGERALKNIDRPIRVYAVSAGALAGLSTAVAAPREQPDQPKPSIAVIPFTNSSGDPGRTLLGRHHRGHHYRPIQDIRPFRGRPEHCVHLQGQAGKDAGGGCGARSKVPPGRQRSQGRPARSHQRPIDRRRGRRPHLGGSLRS